MLTIQRFEQAPTAQAFLDSLKKDESGRDIKAVEAGRLQLSPGGLLIAGEHSFGISSAARIDLAKMAAIPGRYFEDIDPELRATSFNRRLPTLVGRDEAIEFMVSNDNVVDRVRRRTLHMTLMSQMVETIIEALPKDIVSNDTRVVTYQRAPRAELAIISSAQQVQPRQGDIVYGGIHLSIEDSGAVQVGPESFRLACLNGAMARVCAGGKHRLRRGKGTASERTLLATLRDFVRTAWADWQHVKQGLEESAKRPLKPGDLDHIIQGLRQRPFLISASAARRVDEQLKKQGGEPTFYDLHNALTHVGTHDAEVLPQYRYRLRLGAGHLARGKVGVCEQCHRLIVGDDASRN